MISTEKNLREALHRLYTLAAPCRLCPRLCGVDRLAGERGVCRTGSHPRVASAGPHFGEEPPLVGQGGSGTLFLAGCNLRCVFCQNYDISHFEAGTEAGPAEIAALMLKLQELGCHNINFVTPSHVAPWLAEAVLTAREQGLKLPVVYNCGGYEGEDTLRCLRGFVDIYMPDLKFWHPESAWRYARARDYPEVMRRSVIEMQAQVGDLVVANGIAVKGLLIRHLVMPGATDESRAILEFIAREVSPRAWVNVMDQYRPCFEADQFPEIDRRLGADEYRGVYEYAKSLGLNVF